MGIADEFVLLQFETSSLNPEHGYPIEIGWAIVDERGTQLAAPEIHLVIPVPEWTDWDTDLQAVHQIPRSQLFLTGKSVLWIASRLAAAARGRRIVVTNLKARKWLSKLQGVCLGLGFNLDLGQPADFESTLIHRLVGDPKPGRDYNRAVLKARRIMAGARFLADEVIDGPGRMDRNARALALCWCTAIRLGQRKRVHSV